MTDSENFQLRKFVEVYSNIEYSEDEIRTISPIPQQSMSMDADSIIMAADLSAINHSEPNITPLASVFKDDSMKDITETPKSKVVITPSFKNISPFHHVVEPPKTGNIYFVTI